MASRNTRRFNISEPPLLPWTEGNHKHFPKDFKASIRCALLCHHHRLTTAAQHRPAISTSAPSDAAPQQRNAVSKRRRLQPPATERCAVTRQVGPTAGCMACAL